MDRRRFITTLGSGIALSQLGCASGALTRAGTRRLPRIGVQLYSLRDDARRNLEQTLTDIAAAGYHEVELLGSMTNFGMPAKQLRGALDRVGLAAPSTHVGGNALDELTRQLDEAQTLGHRYIIVASLPIAGTPTLDDYRRWADRLNEAGRITRERGVWIGFHNHANDFVTIEGQVAYDVLARRTDPSVVRLQLDTGNVAMSGRDPIEYMRRFGDRYWLFHIKDVPRLGPTDDTELGKGVIDFPRLIGMIENIADKHLFVEQETYPGAPLDSIRRDFTYMASLRY